MIQIQIERIFDHLVRECVIIEKSKHKKKWETLASTFFVGCIHRFLNILSILIYGIYHHRQFTYNHACIFLGIHFIFVDILHRK